MADWTTLPIRRTDQQLWIGDNLVMDARERPLMQAMVDALPAGRILEVGYGLGISARMIREKRQAQIVHLILESHPDLFSIGRADGFDVWLGTWQEQSLALMDGSVDGIFFDPYHHDESDSLLAFLPHAARLLRKGGVLVAFADCASIIVGNGFSSAEVHTVPLPADCATCNDGVGRFLVAVK